MKISFWMENGIELACEAVSFYEFPRGKDGTCAFCKGDPCAELGEGLIAIYVEFNKDWFETCPVCKGMPT
jgi:excinuclease UvrABC ATPase subunit